MHEPAPPTTSHTQATTSGWAGPTRSDWSSKHTVCIRPVVWARGTRRPPSRTGKPWTCYCCFCPFAEMQWYSRCWQGVASARRIFAAARGRHVPVTGLNALAQSPRPTDRPQWLPAQDAVRKNEWKVMARFQLFVTVIVIMPHHYETVARSQNAKQEVSARAFQVLLHLLERCHRVSEIGPTQYAFRLSEPTSALARHSSGVRFVLALFSWWKVVNFGTIAHFIVTW